MKKIILTTLSFFALMLTSFTSYGFSIYSENFDSLTGTLDDAGYVFGVHKFATANAQGSADANILATWYEGAKPTGHTKIEDSIVDGNTSKVAKFWNDYGYAPNYEANASLRTNNFWQTTITADMVAGGTISLSLNYAKADLGDGDAPTAATPKDSQAGAFLKVLQSSDPWAELAYSQLTFDKNAAGWTSITGSIAVDASMVGQFLQVGLFTESQNYAETGVYADDILVTAVPEPSTYALLAGFLAFIFVAIRRRK